MDETLKPSTVVPGDAINMPVLHPPSMIQIVTRYRYFLGRTVQSIEYVEGNALYNLTT
jgi:hypothetical protein